MGIISFLSKMFGTKSERDLKALTPILNEILALEDEFLALSNDELRSRTQELRKGIHEHIKDEENKIAELKEKAQNLDIWEREEVFNEVDKIEEKIDKKIEEHLLTILPQAFAILKETARRFKDNAEVVVTASDFDRELAASNDFVTIDRDMAIWKNSWVAGGNTVTWDMVHYNVQLIGGIVLHQGKIAEMATGEGKTLVATLPVFLNALTGRGVHVVTVNDYLAKRDSEWMGPLYMFHGLSVDCIDKHEPNSEARRKAYASDITFGTNNEFGFDYLRDNMALSPADLVQRKHNYAIVDEVDSVLIDDARTPLIISGPTPKGDDQLFDDLKPQVQQLVAAQKDLFNKIFNDAKKLISESNLKDGGFKLLQAYKALPKNKALIKFLSEQGMKALLQKTENFYMQDNNKMMHLATDDLYFVIEEKLNSVDLTDKGFDLLANSTSDPNFFVMPDIGVALAELEKENLPTPEKLQKKDEIIRDYSIKSERIHTINQLLKAYTMFEKDVDYVIIDNKVKIVDEQTGRIMEGRRWSDGLHQAVESKENVKVEAATQTYATITLQNYFRMYHKLSGMTGTAETEAGEFWDIYKLDVVTIPTNKPVVRNDYEDLIYKTTKEKYAAVIDEIERLVSIGRPVLVGTTSVEVSELLSKILTRKGIKHNVLNAKLHKREADIVAEAGQSSTVTIATNMAGRGTDIKLSPEVRAAGGLAIIGTERHESRRVDRQLRGRAGRQGDPGSSQFFVSLEDNLMRLFGSDRIAAIMDRMGHQEGEAIQHSMISKSIERAQKKVEENNFGIRKHLLEYDDVMNAQRTVIYKKRRNALDGERLGADIANMMNDVCVSVVDECYGSYTYDEFKFEVFKTLAIDIDLEESKYDEMSRNELVDYLYETLRETHKRKAQQIAEQAYPTIKYVFENKGNMYKNIIVPITDGVKTYNVVVNLEKAYQTKGEEIVHAYDKTAVLRNIDESWKEHLREMDDLRQSVRAASYEQKDPLLIYKLESYNIFKEMLDKTNRSIISILMKAYIPMSNPDEVKEAHQPRQRLDTSRMRTGREEIGGNHPQYNDPSAGKPKNEPVRVEKKVGRNDPCPCGSGKKFKNCHGAMMGENE
ncbi:MAG: preprotein translocase subunit SecA [Bacteroidales bacterium]|nr:preprotein translocase subunit SecA [Bacteroidales bacterium]